MDHNKVIENLVNFAIPSYYDALNILLVNRDWMPRFVDQNSTERMVIIEKINMGDENAIDAIQKTRSLWLKKIRDIKEQISTIKKDELADRASEVLSKMIDPKTISAGFMTSDTIEGITADILHNCLEKYRGQNKFFDNKKIIDKLSHPALALIRPIIQVGVCGSCHHFELLAATYPKKDSHCANCDRPLSLCRIYGLDDNFELHKKQNKDLPLFIQAFLLNNTSNMVDIQCSHKVIDAETKKIKTDIDVFIKSSGTGIECKLFVNDVPLGNQFETYKGELLSSFEAYSKFGLTRLIAITNLNQSEAKNAEDEIKQKLNEKGIFPEFIKIGFFSFENLISILNNEIEIIKK